MLQSSGCSTQWLSLFHGGSLALQNCACMVCSAFFVGSYSFARPPSLPFLPRVSEPSRGSLARACSWFCWSPAPSAPDAPTAETCDRAIEAAGLQESEIVSLKAGANLLVGHIRKVLRDFPTSLEEDELEMARVKACAGQGSRNGRSDCVGNERDWADGMLMAIQFRMERKKMLQRVVSHLARNCMNVHQQTKAPKHKDSQEHQSGHSDDGEL